MRLSVTHALLLFVFFFGAISCRQEPTSSNLELTLPESAEPPKHAPERVSKLTIDDNNFEMFSKGDTAWVDTGTDKKIVAAMKAGKSLKVKGTSWRGKTTEDSYSLQGISAALAAIDKACK